MSNLPFMLDERQKLSHGLVLGGGTRQGWSRPAPDEAWQHGYPQEFQDFIECIHHDREPLSGMELARDTIATPGRSEPYTLSPIRLMTPAAGL